MKNLWNNIENDLNEVLDPHFHKKKYEKMTILNKKVKPVESVISQVLSFKDSPQNLVKKYSSKLSMKNMPIKPIVSIDRKKLTRRTTKNANECIF